MANVQRGDSGLFFEIAMAAAHMYPNDKKSSVLAMEVEPVNVIDTNFWKRADQRLDATLETRPTISPVTNRGCGIPCSFDITRGRYLVVTHRTSYVRVTSYRPGTP